MKLLSVKTYIFHYIRNGLDAAELNRFRAFVDDFGGTETLVRKHLSIEMLEKAASITPTIMDCIEHSKILRENVIGIAAVSPDCYTHLANIFEPIIEEYHCIAADVRQPNCQWGDSNEFEKFDDDSVQAIRISCRRSIGKQAFVIGMNENQLTEVLAMVRVFVTPNIWRSLRMVSFLLKYNRFSMPYRKCLPMKWTESTAHSTRSPT